MDVILYSIHCPMCMVLEKKLQSANIDYKIETDEDLMLDKGFVTLPILEVDGNAMDFKAAIDWINNR